MMEEATFSGIVKPNKRNGTKFGYPTANISINDKQPPGLFIGYTSLEKTDDKKAMEAFAGQEKPSIVFIGIASTVGEKDHRLESFILDFPPTDLYGSKIKVTLIEKLRDNKKFNNEAELIKQMKKDELAARKWFNL